MSPDQRYRQTMIDDPSRAQVSPRTNSPAGRSMSFLYGAGLFGSMIQMDPAMAPGNAAAASRFPSGDQARDPFAMRGAFGPSSGLASTRCTVGSNQLGERATSAARLDVRDDVVARPGGCGGRPGRRKTRRLSVGDVHDHQAGRIADGRCVHEPPAVRRPEECVHDVGVGDETRRTAIGADDPHAATPASVGHERDQTPVRRERRTFIDGDAVCER